MNKVARTDAPCNDNPAFQRAPPNLQPFSRETGGKRPAENIVRGRLCSTSTVPHQLSRALLPGALPPRGSY
eukprot:1282352-Pyramimonas_sp.AAC.2